MKNILILLLVSSCALFKNEPELSPNSKEVPEWVYAPYESCDEAREFCASGEGKTFAHSDSQARNNLASIFEVNVKSEFNVQTSSSESLPWQNTVRQEMQHSVAESVDQILEVVQIKQRFKGKEGLSYSLASIDRVKGSELLGKRLQNIDEELEVLWENRNRLSLRKILRLFFEREKTNERYSILSGAGRPSLMSFKEIIQWRESQPEKEDLTLQIGQAPEWMKSKLKELLSEAGYRIVKGNARQAVAMNVVSIKEYLNVKGFEKYTFIMKMASIKGGRRHKILSFSDTVTGRNQTDALLKVKASFDNYIEENISSLNLD